MSEYFRALNRLDKQRPEPQRSGPRLAAAQRPIPEPPPPAPEPAPRPHEILHPLPVSRREASAFGKLLDNIRVLTHGRPTRTLVFAGASDADSARAVVANLATQAQRQGLTVAMAQLAATDGQPLLQQHPETTEFVPGMPVHVDLRTAAGSSDAANWLERGSRSADLILIEGPPLSYSLDSVLLARACDGLVLVAETEVTTREALQLAADRARGAGCRTLGVVMHGTKERLPTWLRELLGDHHLLLAEAEDE